MVQWILGKLVQLVVSVIGLALLVGWWALTDEDFDLADFDLETYELPNELPGTVEGGGHLIAVELATSEPVRFVAEFDCGEGDEPVAAAGYELLGAGVHNVEFDVPGHCWYGWLEAAVEEPPVGASLSWSVSIDGHPYEAGELTLDEPLEANQVFSLETGWDDFSLEALAEWSQEQG